MIPTAIIVIIRMIIGGLNSFLPAWTPWPASVTRGFVLFGQWSQWFSPWLEVTTFWQVAIFDFLTVGLVIVPTVILLRVFHIKIFK